MKKFLTRILLLAIIAYAAQYLIGVQLLKRRNRVLEEVYFPIKRWNEFHAQPGHSIDMLFLGSSHCYRSFIPQVFDSILNVNSYNLGSSNQSLSTSYFVLKEALETQKPKTVVLEIYHGTLCMKNNYINLLHNYPQMQSPAKYQMLQTLPVKERIDLLLFPLKWVSINKNELIKIRKQHPDTSKQLYSLYKSKGFVTTLAKKDFHLVLKTDAEELKNGIPPFEKKQTKYLGKIARLCQKKGIKLITISQPLHPSYRKELKNYQERYAEIDRICQQLHIPYYNCNEIINIPHEFFYDAEHFLNRGATIYSTFVARLLKHSI